MLAIQLMPKFVMSNKNTGIVIVLAILSVAAYGGDGTIVRAARPTKDVYIVRLAANLAPSASSAAAQAIARADSRVRIGTALEHVFAGFIAYMPEAAALAVSARSDVLRVSEADLWQLDAQIPAPWQLSRIDQRYGVDDSYNPGCPPGPTHVIAYVLDSGVRKTHHEFWTSASDTTSRVIDGRDFIYDITGNSVGDSLNPCPRLNDCPAECENCAHGTSVASLITGNTYGSAKGGKVVSFRVGGGSGISTEALIVALDRVIADHAARTAADSYATAVLNMSFSGPPNVDIEAAINSVINQRNITVTVAAGNENDDAGNHSPARLGRGNGGRVITVGASTDPRRTNGDYRWLCVGAGLAPQPFEICQPNGSNYGAAVDIFAPGQNVESAGIRTCVAGYCPPDDYAARLKNKSGTSFAAPLVAGVAMRVLQGKLWNDPAASPEAVWNTILANATVVPSVMLDGFVGEGGPLNGSAPRLLYHPGPPICRSQPELQ